MKDTEKTQKTQKIETNFFLERKFAKTNIHPERENKGKKEETWKSNGNNDKRRKIKKQRRYFQRIIKISKKRFEKKQTCTKK